VCLCFEVLGDWYLTLEVVFFCSLGFLFLVCVRAVLLLLCPFYNPVGVVLLSFIVCGLVVFLVVVH